MGRTTTSYIYIDLVKSDRPSCNNMTTVGPLVGPSLPARQNPTLAPGIDLSLSRLRSMHTALNRPVTLGYYALVSFVLRGKGEICNRDGYDLLAGRGFRCPG